MDFKNKNKIKVTEYTKRDNEALEDIRLKEDNTYHFLTDDDAVNFRTWTYSDLFSEDRKLVLKEENIEWNDNKAEELEKKNKKYSSKDRNKSMAKVKKIRKKKMDYLGFKHLFVRLDDKKKQLESAEEFINLQFEAREEYIKATMEDSEDFKVDLAMNRMRKYYRRTRLYLSLLRGEPDGKFKNKLTAGFEKNKAKLVAEIKAAKQLPNYQSRFAWKTVTGREEDLSDEKKANIELMKKQAKERAAEEERKQKKLAEIERKKNLVIGLIETGTYKKKQLAEEEKPKQAGGNKAKKKPEYIEVTIKVDEEWFLAEYKDRILGLLGQEQNKDFFEGTDEDLIEAVKKLNDNYKENVRVIRSDGADRLAHHIKAMTKYKDKNAIAKYLRAGFSWVNEFCEKKYLEILKNDLIFKGEAAKYLKALPPKIEVEEMRRIREGAKRYRLISDIDFQGMGINIYDSEIVKTLLTGENIKEDDIIALRRQVEGVDRLLKHMVVKKFGYLNEESIYKGLRRFIGNKAIFAGNRKITDLAERYLLGLSFTDKRTAMIQKDFDDTYAEEITVPYAEIFKTSIEKLISHNKDYYDDKKRKGEFKKRLKYVNTFLGYLDTESAGISMSEEGWENALKNVRTYIREKMYRTWHPDRDSDELLEKLKDVMKKMLKKVAAADTGEKKIGWDEFAGYKQEEMKKEEAEDVNEYSYAELLDQLFIKDDFEQIIPDPALRAFLRENKNVFLFKNKKLMEQMPFMKDIKDIDELENLSFDQFERVAAFLYRSIAENGVPEVIDKLLKNDKVEIDSKRRILLRLLSDKTDKEGAEKYIKEEADRQEKIKKLRRQKMLISIGTSKEKRDGKIRYRYEDLKDRDKSILQTYFGKNSDWLKNRIKKFDKANSVWKGLEKIGPAAMELTRYLFKRVYEADKPKEELERLASCLSSDKPYEELKTNYDIGKLVINGFDDNRKLLVERIANVFKAKDDTAEKQLLDIADKTGVEKSRKKTAPKAVAIKDFLLEMSLCGTQDILLGHKGKYQNVLFMYENMDQYDTKLMEVAKYSINRMEYIDKTVAKYPPEVREELRNKLMRTCLNIETEKFEVYKEHEELKKKNLKAIEANKKTQESTIKALNEATQKLAKIGEEKSVLENEAKSLEKQIFVLKQDKELKKADVQNQKKIITESNKKIKELKARIATLEKEYKKVSDSYIAAEDALRNADTKKQKKAQENYDAAKKIFKEKSGLLTDLNDELSRENRKVGDAEATLNYGTVIIGGIDAQIEEYNEKKKGLNEKIKKLGDEYDELWDTYQNRTNLTVKTENAANFLQYKSEKNEETIAEEFRDETQLNIKEYGIGNLDELGDILKDCVNEQGVMSGELAETIDLYKERKKMLEEYKGGELALISGRLLENNDILMDLLDPAESVAMARISTLYEFFAPFSLAVERQASAFLGDYYLENYLDELLTGKGRLYNGIFHTLKEQDTLDGKVNVWRDALQEFGADYVTQQKKGSKSINENLHTATSDITKKIQKHYLYDTKETKDEKKLQKAQFKKYWFIDSKNYGVELAAQKGGQNDFQIALHKAQGMICQINAYITTNADCIQQACIAGTLKNLYEELGENYIANDDIIENYFVQYMLENKYKVSGISRAMLEERYTTSDKDLNKILESMPPEALKDIKIRLEDFKKYVREPSFVQKPEEFEKNIGKYAKDYFENLDKAIEEDSKLLRENADAYNLRKKNEELARNTVMNAKYEGRDLYNKELFGGKLDALRSFGEQKQTLVYLTKDRGKRKSIRSLGEEADKKMLDAAREYFKPSEKDKEKYPDILAEILVEYMKQNQEKLDKLDRFADWLAGLESRFKVEADRLKKLYRIRKQQMKDEPDEGLDMFMVYAARYTMDEIEVEREMKTLGNRFNKCYKSVRELEEIGVKNPALRLAHRDAIEKSRALIFMDKDIKPIEYDRQIKALISYFVYADQAYEVIDKAAGEDSYLGQLDSVYRNRYVNGLREYYTADIIKMSKSGKPFEAEKFLSGVKKVIGQEYLRRALLNQKDSVSNLDLEPENIYPGAMSLRDFEHVLVATRKPKLVAKYNELGMTDRKLFAMALYCSKMEEHGTQKVIYGQTDSGIKTARAQIMSYMKGEDVEFEVDYARSIRAVSSTNKNFKISADSKLFKEALEFVKKINIRKEELRPKEFDRMADSVSVIKAADLYRGDVQSSAGNVPKQKEALRVTVGSWNRLYARLEECAEEDKKRQGSQGFIDRTVRRGNEIIEGFAVDKVMNRLNGLSKSQKSLLVFVLQDRTVLDFSSAGKDEKTKIVPHANQEKRFKLFEQLIDEKGRFDALTEAGRSDTVQKAFHSLLSFQLRDDKELSQGKLTEDDFVKSSLKRVEVIDWKLLNYAMDFIEECEGERKRLFVARQAKEIMISAKEEKPSAKFYRSHIDYMTEEGVGSLKSFESLIEMAYKEDISVHDTSSGFKKEAEDLLSGYYKLNSAEKALFIRALENRDILDVSQKNLYKNVFGLADRNFVNEKDRDELADSFLANNCSVEYKNDSCKQAFTSLLTDQINDDMDFNEVKGVNWANKNLAVDNQIFVTKRKTALDWKLFKRALQFVTRTVNERKQTAGNELIYEKLGDKEKNGELKIDTKYLRMNLHNTGSRFMRFLAKEGYAEIEDNLGIFDTVGNYAGYVLSTKTNNFIQGELNTFIKDRMVEKAQEEDKEEEEKEEKKEGEQKVAPKLSFLDTLTKLANDYTEQKATLEEMFNTASQTYDDIKELMSDDEKEIEKTDELKENLKDIKVPEEKKEGYTGYKYVDLVIKGGIGLAKVKGYLDKFATDTETLEKIDGYIEDYLGGFMSTKSIGDWYAKKVGLIDENGNKPDPDQGFIDKKVPEWIKKDLGGLLEEAEKTGELLKLAKESFFDPTIEVIGDLKDIYESYQNISKLNDAKEDSAKKHDEDTEKIKKSEATKEEKEAIEKARQNNIDLLKGGNDMTKNIESRKILLTTGQLAQKILKFAGHDEFNKFIDKAFKFAGFIWHCMSDDNAIKNFYSASGNEELEKLYQGRVILKDRFKHDDDIKISTERYEKEGDKIVVGKPQVRMLKNGLGFESDEELVKFLRLNIVNSLLFSASKFNPFAEPQLLAECTLTVLGLESAIGKTDNETARKVFEKLSA